MRQVRYCQYGGEIPYRHGTMDVKDIVGRLQKQEKEAASLMKETGADHVLYGLKIYGETGKLEAVQFYMWPMDERQFDVVARGCRCGIAYALHRR